MGHNVQKMEGKVKKNVGKMTGNKKMEMKGTIKESTAKIKDKF
ncbi:MAG TPA: hypothetical protein VFH37_01885 [Candidatus Saccharimonadales bacterium]|nr:hypothetical protein [Candidatus Saccharimonadales bacterium]